MIEPKDLNYLRQSFVLARQAVVHPDWVVRLSCREVFMKTESILTTGSANIKYGPGAIVETGIDMKAFGGSRVMVVTDERLAKMEQVSLVLESLEKRG